MSWTVLISAAALVVSIAGAVYKLGQDTKNNSTDKLDQIVSQTDRINRKLDSIAEWQREAAKIHTTHDERIKTLFNRVEALENRTDNLDTVKEKQKKILERVS